MSYWDDLEKDAVESIKLFLGDKNWFCGGEIPQAELFSKESTDLVLKTNFDDGVKYAQKFLMPKLIPPRDYTDPTVPYEIHFFLQVKYELGHLEISRDFHAGLILLYLKFCKGYYVPDEIPYIPDKEVIPDKEMKYEYKQEEDD